MTSLREGMMYKRCWPAPSAAARSSASQFLRNHESEPIDEAGRLRLEISSVPVTELPIASLDPIPQTRSFGALALLDKSIEIGGQSQRMGRKLGKMKSVISARTIPVGVVTGSRSPIVARLWCHYLHRIFCSGGNLAARSNQG